jgi:hypothetical protein
MTKKNRTILIAAIVLVVGTVIVVTIAFRHSGKPDFAKMSPQQIRQYFDSNEFRDANEDKRRETFQQMGEMMMKRMTSQAEEYATLHDDEKTVYLDKIIDEMEARRAEFFGRDANRPDANGPTDPNRFRRFGPPDANRPRFGMGGPNGQRFQPNPQRGREFSSMMSADTMVKMTQFGRDMMNRMQQRGIQMPMMGGPGGRSPGGPGGPP